jgi:hypothetical protein
VPVPSWACFSTGHGQPAVTGPRPPPEPVDAKPPTPQARPRGGSHRRAATPPKSSLASADRHTCPNRAGAATALRDQFAGHGAMPHRPEPPACPAGMRSELENLRVCGFRDRLNKRLQIFGATGTRPGEGSYFA